MRIGTCDRVPQIGSEIEPVLDRHHDVSADNVKAESVPEKRRAFAAIGATAAPNGHVRRIAGRRSAKPSIVSRPQHGQHRPQAIAVELAAPDLPASSVPAQEQQRRSAPAEDDHRFKKSLRRWQTPFAKYSSACNHHVNGRLFFSPNRSPSGVATKLADGDDPAPSSGSQRSSSRRVLAIPVDLLCNWRSPELRSSSRPSARE